MKNQSKESTNAVKTNERGKVALGKDFTKQ